MPLTTTSEHMNVDSMDRQPSILTDDTYQPSLNKKVKLTMSHDTDPVLCKETAAMAIDKNERKLRDLSLYIHSNPELGFEEIKAHNALTRALKDVGFKVHDHYHLDTGFRAEFGDSSTGPTVAVMCEYDSLPGLGHACGHNLISEAGVAAGLGVKAAMETNNCPGKIVVLGTPAEEGNAGKAIMLKSGAFQGIDCAIMAHPNSYNLLAGMHLALIRMKVVFNGRAAHASAYPWEGVNALDAAVACYSSISHLRQQMKPTWRVHAIISDGGKVPNIIPERSELQMYLRAPVYSEVLALKERIMGCAEGAAKAAGCTYETHDIGEAYLPVLANPVILDLFTANAESAGLDYDPSLGPVPRGSTDMGNVSFQMPSIHPLFAIGTDANIHTSGFAEASSSKEANSKAIQVGKALAFTAIDILSQDGVLNSAKMAYREQIRNA